MMILNTLAEQISSNKVRVLWRNGTQMKGVLAITVNFSAAEKDIPVIAELIAIRYLVVEKKVFGSVPKGGSSIRLCVGSREIPQLVKEQENNAFAGRFAGFLAGRMAGIGIEVSDNREFMVTEEEIRGCEETFILDEPGHYGERHEQVDTPAMGKVWVTAHAVQRYQERDTGANGETMKNPWSSFTKRIMNPDLQQTPLNARARIHKLIAHGSETEVWCHPSDTLRFVLSIGTDGSKYLVTVFERDNSHW